MPIFLLIVGVLLIIVAINDKTAQLGDLIAEDFKPSSSVPGFPVWILAIFIAGSLGFIREMRPVANAFLALIIVSLVLSNRGFFTRFKSGIEGN